MTRTTVVRVHNELDGAGCRMLGRILADLIDHQGATDLIVDLSAARHIDPALRSVLTEAEAEVERLGGALEIRTPPEPTGELLGLLDDITTFVPAETVTTDHPG